MKKGAGEQWAYQVWRRQGADIVIHMQVLPSEISKPFVWCIILFYGKERMYQIKHLRYDQDICRKKEAPDEVAQ